MSLYGISWFEAVSATLAIVAYTTLCAVVTDVVLRRGERVARDTHASPRRGTDVHESAPSVATDEEMGVPIAAS
jgi:hypothetical protein